MTARANLTTCVLILSAFLLNGCASEEPQAQDASGESSAAKTPEQRMAQDITPNGTSPQNEALGDTNSKEAQANVQIDLPDDLNPTLADADRPTTPEGFADEFRSRFAKDIYSGFIDLAYWGDAGDEGKREYLEGIQSTFIDEKKRKRGTMESPDDIRILTLEQYGDPRFVPNLGDDSIKLIPPATHVLGVSGHFNEYFRVTNFYAVGELDGKFYFCTIDRE